MRYSEKSCLGILEWLLPQGKEGKGETVYFSPVAFVSLNILTC